MACMCGDTHCWSCGPAQGNWRCILCNKWADEGCEHIDEETGEYDSKFLNEVNKAVNEVDVYDRYYNHALNEEDDRRGGK